MRQRNANIATVISYPFGAGFGWVACHLGMPIWLAFLLAIPAGMLSSAISNALWKREMTKYANA